MTNILTLILTLPRLFTGRRNRRAFDREAVTGRAELRVGRRVIACSVVNVSVTGALVIPTMGLRPGTAASLTLSGCPLVAKAQIVRVDGEGVGLSFKDPEIGAALAGWVKGIAGIRTDVDFGGLEDAHH
jgi:hypothetical protein